MLLRYGQAVDSIYSAAANPSQWPDALQHVSNIFEDAGTILLYQRDDGSFGHIWSPAMGPLMADFAAYGGPDFRAVRALERGLYFERNIVVDADLVTASEMEEHPYYKLLGRHGLRHCAAAVICPHPRVATGVSIQRSRLKLPFSPDELQLFEKICHHIESALRLSIRLINSEASNDGYEDALRRLGIGLVTIDYDGAVAFCNSAAENLIGHGLSISRSRKLVGRGAGGASLRETINLALSNDAEAVLEPRPILIERSEDRRPLTCYVLPIRRSEEASASLLAFIRAIVLIIDSDSSEPADPAAVRDILGVTLGEARVASLIGAGLSPREAAERLGIAEVSARTVLKRVFVKTGLSKQSELATLLTRLVLR